MTEGYTFGTHVLPRMSPALVFVTVASLVWLVPLRSAGSSRWVMLGVVLAVTVAAWAVVSLFVRRLPRFSRAAVVAILVGYVAMPVVVPLLQLAVDDVVTPPGGTAAGLLEFVVFFAVVFAVTLLVTTHGFGTLLRRAVRHTVYDLRNSVRLLGRALPAILFVTGELWQSMNRLPWWRLALVVLLFGAATCC